MSNDSGIYCTDSDYVTSVVKLFLAVTVVDRQQTESSTLDYWHNAIHLLLIAQAKCTLKEQGIFSQVT